jgi:hypothetical protein
MNIERMLQDHLWNEILSIETKISEFHREIESLTARKDKLERIASAAEIPHPDD